MPVLCLNGVRSNSLKIEIWLFYGSYSLFSASCPRFSGRSGAGRRHMPAQPLRSPMWKLDRVGVWGSRTRGCSATPAVAHSVQLCADQGPFASQHLPWSASAVLLVPHQPSEWTDVTYTVFLFVLTASRGIFRLSPETQYLGNLRE